MKDTKFTDMLLEVMHEYESACARHSTWPTDPLHAFAVVAEEVGECQKEVLQNVYEPHKTNITRVREEAVQMAAMSLRFLMGLDKYEFKGCVQHAQKD